MVSGMCIFQCLLIWIIVGQGRTVLAVGAGGGCSDIFSRAYHFPFPPPTLWHGWIDDVILRLFQ